MHDCFQIGVDGGGTKTECILVDKTGEVVKRHIGPGCNPSLVGPEKARELLRSALEVLLAGVSPRPNVSRTLLCMAGSGPFWRETAATLTGFGRAEAGSDALPVLELATDGRPGVAVHAGTGSFVILRTPSNDVRYLGGLGWRIGDPGSAHDIGRRALARSLAEMQGWAPRSALGDAIASTFETHDAAAVTSIVYHDAEPNRRIVALSSHVADLAAAGDSLARSLVIDSARELLGCALAGAAHFGLGANRARLRIGVSGSILTQPFVVQALAPACPHELHVVTEAPSEGVRRMLMHGA